MASRCRVTGPEVVKRGIARLAPDLMTGARQAVADMVELLAARYGMNPVDAYMLVSTCGDLRISEIVDMPNWVVSFYFPRVVFE